MQMGDGSGTVSGPTWARGVFMDDHVYAVSADAVKAAEVDSIAEPVYSLILSQ
jgi:hypothetical protein